MDNQLLSLNIDRSRDNYLGLMMNVGEAPNRYLAVLLQDAPKIALASQSTTLPNQFKRFEQIIVSKELETILLVDVNTDKCLVNKVHRLGNVEAAGLMIELTLLNSHHSSSENKQFYLTNIYIRPKASYNDTRQLLEEIQDKCKGRFSRLIMAGDLNATSAMWDPANLEIVDKARTTKAEYYKTKILRGNIIERFIIKHGLKCLQQANQPQPTYTNAERITQEKPTHSWIDLVLVGTKANRVWHSLSVSGDTTDRTLAPKRGHRAITVLCTQHRQHQNNGETKTTKVEMFRYRPERIARDDLLELKLRVAKLRNNWQRCDRKEQIERLEQLEQLTDLTMKTIKTIKAIQDTKTKIPLRSRQPRPLDSITGILKRLYKTKSRKNKLNRETLRHKATVARLRKLQTAKIKNDRAKNKLMTKMKKRIKANELELWSRVRLVKAAGTESRSSQVTTETISSREQLDELAEELFPQQGACPIDRLLIHIMEQHEPIVINEQELRTAERVLGKKRYTGPDGVRFSTFNPTGTRALQGHSQAELCNRAHSRPL